MTNRDEAVIRDFGAEWARFDQAPLTPAELQEIFDTYFHIFPWDALPPGAVGFDLGCGSGRWARLVAPRVGVLHCIDPSPALDAAAGQMRDLSNCRFHRASVDAIPLADHSADFGYSLGVLHHIPDVAAGLAACVGKLRVGAPFLLYLYYAFDNRPRWYGAVWRMSDLARRAISNSPGWAKNRICDAIAALIYWPMARLASLLQRLRFPAASLPLSFYSSRSFYVMRTDALDRFGTRLERRFSREEIRQLMERAGLERVVFSDRPPFWCALGYRGVQ